MTMPSRPSLGGGEGEVRVHIFQHDSGGVAKRMLTLGALLSLADDDGGSDGENGRGRGGGRG